MAYKNLLNVSCASTAEVFRHVKDWLTSRNGIADYSTSGLGWTLHDSYFATDADNLTNGDWVVLYSSGEDGKQQLYYKMTFTSAVSGSILTTMAGLYFNASTNAWVLPFHSAEITGGPTTGTTFSLWIFGDLSSFSIIIGNGTTNFGRYFGLAADTPHDATSIATSTGAVTAGTDRVVTVDSVPASFAVGKTIYIRDADGKMERTTITAISGTDITVTLTNSYASGAKLARDYVVYLSNVTNFVSGGYVQVARDGSFASKTCVAREETTVINQGDPDAMAGFHLTEHVQWYQNNQGGYGRPRDIVLVSTTGITSGTSYADEAGNTYRALLVNSKMYMFKEV